MPLGNLAGEVALIQMRVGRGLLAGNPQVSDLWQLADWQLIAKLPQFVRAVIHQCMLGLRSPRSGLPIKKPTAIWAVNPTLVTYLRSSYAMDVMCTHNLMHERQEHPLIKRRLLKDCHCQCADMWRKVAMRDCSSWPTRVQPLA